MRSALALAVLAGCAQVPPAATPFPPSVPAPAHIESEAAPLAGTLGIRTVAGRDLSSGDTIAASDALEFVISGSPGAYLYLVASRPDGDHLLQLSPAWSQPGTGEVDVLVPRPSWLTDADERPTGWTPEAVGAISYVLVAAPVPRGTPGDPRLAGGLPQLLAPPPYVAGPAGAPAVEVARLELTRGD